MKTNQVMTVTIGEHTFPIEHKTMFGHLNQFWDCGNSYRIKKGLPPKHLDNWLRSVELWEYIEVLERELLFKNPLESTSSKYVESTDYKPIDFKEEIIPKIKGQMAESVAKHTNLIRTKRGRSGGTWAHLYILIDAATFLDPEFRFQVYQTFVEGKLLHWRDESGDCYKPFNMAIASLPDRVGKDNKWLFVTAANLIAERIGVESVEEGNRWNYANGHQLAERAYLEKMLTRLIQIGGVRDWSHLKELIAKF